MNIRQSRFWLLAGLLILAAGLAACGETPVPVTPTPPPTATPAAPAVVPTIPPTLPTPIPRKETTMNLTWLGHSTFILETSTGLKVLLDPMNASVGYPINTVTGMDLVTVSHEHGDHNNVSLAAGSPLILRGLAGGAKPIDQTVKGVRVRTVLTNHDDTQGSQRGQNAIFIFEADQLRLAHLGDLGHPLTTDQVKAVGPVDIILIPVGGYYTIDAKAAATVVNQLNPKVIIPMHYKTPDLGASLAGRLAPVDDFTAALGTSATVSEAGHTVTLDANNLPAKRTVMIMKYK